MPRRFFSTTCLLGGLLCLTAHAQSDLPTKVGVAGARQLNVNQKTVLRVALLNGQGREVAAVSDTPVTLFATRQKDARSARADVHGAAPQRADAFSLPADRNTAHTVVTIPRGQTHVGVGFSAGRAGAVRVYGESAKYESGYALIAVSAARAARARGRDLFVNASSRDEPPDGLYIAVEPEGTDAPSIEPQTREWVRRFDVVLYSGEAPVDAPRQIRVALRVRQGQGRVEPSVVVIPKGKFVGEPRVEVRTRSGGDVKVAAVPVQEDGAPVGAAAPVTFNFPAARVATGLVVEPFPSAQPASGRDPIRLVVRAVDDARNTILCTDEGLAQRDVTLTLNGESYGLKFEDGAATVSIRGDQLSGERKIFGFGPVSGTKVIARARNGLGVDIVGEGEIEFRFPWWQLGFALLGGASLPVSRKLAAARGRPRAPRELLTGVPVEAALGALAGGIFFGFVFFGAVVIAEMNWSGIPILLTALPIQHSAFAAFLIGFLGGALVGTRSFLRSAIAGRLLRESPAG